MNAMNDPASLSLQDEGEAGSATTFTLRRTGRKAIRFDGWQLIEAFGSDGNRSVWHDLNLYRTVKSCIVVELVARRTAPDNQDINRVKTFEDMAAAAAWLEAFRPADDIPIPPGLGAADTALPWAVLQAVQLRQSIDRLECEYQSLISDVFAALELTDPVEGPLASTRRKPLAKIAA